MEGPSGGGGSRGVMEGPSWAVDDGRKCGGNGEAKWAAIEEQEPEKKKRKGVVTDDDAAPRKTPKP